MCKDADVSQHMICPSVCSCILLWSDMLSVYLPSALSPQQRTVEKVQS